MATFDALYYSFLKSTPVDAIETYRKALVVELDLVRSKIEQADEDILLRRLQGQAACLRKLIAKTDEFLKARASDKQQ